MGAGAGQGPDPPEQRAAERLGGHAVAPHRGQLGHGRARVAVGGHEHAVERPHRGAEHQVGPDPGLGEGLEHADLVGAEHPAAAEHEGDLVRPALVPRHRPSLVRPMIPQCLAGLSGPRRTGRAGGWLPGLRIAVLGKPRVTRDDDSPVELGSAKATALLLYLATTGERHSRSALAGLLWGDLPEEGARANLRLALTKLRRVADDNLQVTRGYVAVDPSSYWLDRRELEAALAGGDGDLERVRAAVGLYRGDFLDDLVVRGAPEFEDWAEREREHLRRLAVTGLARLADDAAARSDPAAGVELARRMLSLDPLSEEAHRLLMRFLAQKDDRAAALAQFETCRHVLAEELGVEPSPETVRLTERIRAGELARPPRPGHA